MYSLRHTHCALRIMNGDNFLAIARDMRTSISQIDATYGQEVRPGFCLELDELFAGVIVGNSVDPE